MSYFEMGLMYTTFVLALAAFKHSQDLEKRVAELEAAAKTADGPSTEGQRA